MSASVDYDIECSKLLQVAFHKAHRVESGHCDFVMSFLIEVVEIGDDDITQIKEWLMQEIDKHGGPDHFARKRIPGEAASLAVRASWKLKYFLELHG